MSKSHIDIQAKLNNIKNNVRTNIEKNIKVEEKNNQCKSEIDNARAELKELDKNLKNKTINSQDYNKQSQILNKKIKENKENVQKNINDNKKNSKEFFDNLNQQNHLQKKLPPQVPKLYSQGDPHFSNFLGNNFDIQPIGDVYLLRSSFYELEVHIRCHMQNPKYNVSYATGILIKINKNIIEYNAASNKFYINKQIAPFKNNNLMKKIEINFKYQNSFSITQKELLKINVLNINKTLSISIFPTMDLLKKCQSSILGSLNFNHFGKIIKTPKNLFVEPFEKNALYVNYKHFESPISELPVQRIQNLRNQGKINEIQMTNMLFDLDNTPPELHNEVTTINEQGIIFINETTKREEEKNKKEEEEKKNKEFPQDLKKKINEFQKILKKLNERLNKSKKNNCPECEIENIQKEDPTSVIDDILLEFEKNEHNSSYNFIGIGDLFN